MTASEPAHDAGARSLAERALDLVLYAPAGALLSALEDLPGMAAKGRARVDQEVRNARVVGRFAVDFGLRQLKEQIEWLAREGRTAAAPPPPAGPPPAPPRRVAAPAKGPVAAPRRAAPSRERPSEPRPNAPAAPATPPAGRRGGRDAAVDRAIPQYDTLSASQVVRRLDSLGEAELRAVIRHELANRGRRTILHRAEQLLGTARAGVPDAGGAAAARTEPPDA